VNLSNFQRPGRYIGCEVNSVRKDAPVGVALAFPDIYDIGMSHLGLKILYKIINDIPYASAERVFHPWLDMEEAMRRDGIPISSLESKRALGSFDIVGFSLQYELSYTSILNMLSLGNIPLKSEERDKGFPLIIAGGPCAVNPLPMSPFIDAFLVGDGEEAVKEIIEVFFGWKKEGDGKKDSLLKALSGLEGVYVPSMGKGHVRRRILQSLEDAPYPTAPVVPFTSVVHDRLNIEVSRGCTMGCRFCQAGIIYRPLRERSPQTVLKLAEETIKNTGYGEVSFTSLSAGDYGCLLPLIKEFNRRFGGKKVSVSLPSVRVKALNRDVLREIKSVRKTGFTIAPEAATERLRCVINKDFSMEDYERGLDALFSEGWLNLKLYYMLGLPSETEKDIEEIPGMVLTALKTAKRHTRRFVNISVGISPFVPKPHTPFQWCGQAPMEDIRRKKEYLRARLRKKGINIREHDAEASLLEAAISRGDEGTGRLIEAAWRRGARLDGWGEHFDMKKWLDAMDASGVDAFSYAGKTFGLKESLPWEVVDTGVDKAFLLREYENALAGKITDDCRRLCAGCGLDCPKQEEGKAPEIKTVLSKKPSEIRRPVRLRVEFSKTGALRFLSHRELITHLERSIRRADIPVAYTEGFHPSQKVSFGPPLGVGISGMREYFDIELTVPYDLRLFKDKLNKTLSDGVRILKVSPVQAGRESLQGFISGYEYEIICNDTSVLEGFSEKKEIIVRRDDEAIDIKGMVESLKIIDGKKARLLLRDMEDKKVRLDEILRAVFPTEIGKLDVARVSLSGRNGGTALPIKEGL
jgi:radical SAM-linked protein